MTSNHWAVNCYSIINVPFQCLDMIFQLNHHCHLCQSTTAPWFWLERKDMISYDAQQQRRCTVDLWPWNHQELVSILCSPLMHENETLSLNTESQQQKSTESKQPIVVRLQPNRLNSCLLSGIHWCWVCRWAGRWASWRLWFWFVDCYRQRVDTCQERGDHQTE